MELDSLLLVQWPPIGPEANSVLKLYPYFEVQTKLLVVEPWDKDKWHLSEFMIRNNDSFASTEIED